MRVRWRRLFVYPRAHLRHWGPEVELEVRGLVCSLCAQRVRQGLIRLPQVKEAQVDLESGLVRVQLKAPTSWESLERAVMDTVIWPWGRRLLALVPFLGRR